MELGDEVLEASAGDLVHVVVPAVAPITMSLPRIQPDLLEQPVLVFHFLFDVFVFLEHPQLVIALFFLLVFQVFDAAPQSLLDQLLRHHLLHDLIHFKREIWLRNALRPRVELKHKAVTF